MSLPIPSLCVLNWYQLLSVFQTVDFLENRASGIKHTQSSGCNIMTPEEDATWQVLCVQYPDAAPFRNCGWEIYNNVKKLCPNKAKGTHSFYPLNGTQGMCDLTSTEASQGSKDPSMSHEFSPDWLDPLQMDGLQYGIHLWLQGIFQRMARTSGCAEDTEERDPM